MTLTEKVPYAVPVEIFCPVFDQVDGLDLLDVTFTEIEDKDGVWWIGLTPSQYERLSKNVAEITRYIKGSKAEINHYKSCIIKSSERVDTSTLL